MTRWRAADPLPMNIANLSLPARREAFAWLAFLLPSAAAVSMRLGEKIGTTDAVLGMLPSWFGAWGQVVASAAWLLVMLMCSAWSAADLCRTHQLRGTSKCFAFLCAGFSFCVLHVGLAGIALLLLS